VVFGEIKKMGKFQRNFMSLGSNKIKKRYNIDLDLEEVLYTLGVN